MILIYRSYVPSSAAISGNAVVTSMTNPFGSSLDSKVWQTHASPSQYSIRWSGMYMAHMIGQHTFSISAGALSNVKFFINNVMLFQTGGNDKSATIVLDRGVNAMYDVLIEFQVRSISQITNVPTYSPSAFGSNNRLDQHVRIMFNTFLRSCSFFLILLFTSNSSPE